MTISRGPIVEVQCRAGVYRPANSMGTGGTHDVVGAFQIDPERPGHVVPNNGQVDDRVRAFASSRHGHWVGDIASD